MKIVVVGAVICSIVSVTIIYVSSREIPSALIIWYELFQRNRKWSRESGKKSGPMAKNIFTVLNLREGDKNGPFWKFCRGNVLNKAK